jgi:hypothetical protein
MPEVTAPPRKVAIRANVTSPSKIAVSTSCAALQRA